MFQFLYMQQKPKISALAQQNLNVLWERSAKIGVPIAAFGGFVADVLAPLGPFVAVLATMTGILCVISGIVWFGFKRREIKRAMEDGKIDKEEFTRIGQVSNWSVAFAFNLVASIVLMVFFGAQKAFANPEAPERGALAGAVPQIAKIQAQLLGLKETTDRIDATTQRLETKADAMHDAINQLDSKIAAIKPSEQTPDTMAVSDADCAAPKALSPYAKVFVGPDILVEMATVNAKNTYGMNDVLLRMRGPAAFEANLDGQVTRYIQRPGPNGGVDVVYRNPSNQEPVRMIFRHNHEGEMVRVFLKDDKPYDLKLDAKRSKVLCPVEMEKAFGKTL